MVGKDERTRMRGSVANTRDGSEGESQEATLITHQIMGAGRLADGGR